MSEGKEEIVEELLGQQSGKSLLVGDGTSDLLAGEAVDLFVGFGGVAVRPRVRDHAPVFIEAAGLAAILPLAAGPAALARLEETSYRALFSQGIADTEESTHFGDVDLADKMKNATTALSN